MTAFRSILTAALLVGSVACARSGLPRTTASFAGTSVVEVPYRLVNGLVTIPVSINGSAPLQLILDTGAPVIVLRDSTLVTTLGLNVVGRTRLGGAGDAEPRMVPLVAGMTAKVGALEARNASGVITGLESAISGADGVIGAAFFSNAVVELDFERKVVRFHDPAMPVPTMVGDTLPLRVAPSLHSFLAGTIVVNGTTMAVDLHLDTGARQSLAIARETMVSKGAKPTHAIPTIVGFGSRGAARGDLIRAAELRLGKTTIASVPAAVMDQEPGGQARVGLPILERFRVWIDFPNKRVVLAPRANLHEPFPTNTTGLILRPGRDSVPRVIADVPAGTPAHEAGLQVGDTLTSFNGRELTAVDEQTLRLQVVTATPGAPIALTVRRAGTQLERRIVPRVLLP